MRVLLIGDSCTDVYVYGDVKRLNPEAPVPILEPKREDKTNGTFDILHPGHIELFKVARALGDKVIVATDTDEKIKTDRVIIDLLIIYVIE